MALVRPPGHLPLRPFTCRPSGTVHTQEPLPKLQRLRRDVLRQFVFVFANVRANVRATRRPWIEHPITIDPVTWGSGVRAELSKLGS